MIKTLDKQGYVKICGIQNVRHAIVAAQAGSDALGFVLAPSRRRVDASLVVEVREHLTRIGKSPRLVAVVVNEHEDALREIVELAQPDVVQLSGDEEPGVLSTIDATVCRTIRVPHGSSFDRVQGMIDPWLDHDNPVEAVLFESYSSGHFGGTGKVADWELAARLAETYPVILAGGLTPENIMSGIDTVHPYGVDVSSGVETDGIKDPDRIRLFVDRADHAFQAMT